MPQLLVSGEKRPKCFIQKSGDFEEIWWTVY